MNAHMKLLALPQQTEADPYIRGSMGQDRPCDFALPRTNEKISEKKMQ